MLSCKVQWISDVCCAALANTLLPVLCLRPPPEPAKPSPGPLHYPTTCVTLPQASHPPPRPLQSEPMGSAPPTTQQTPQQQTPPQPPSSSSGPRYPPREVPPRFRQQEHKQLLKRGQPLPAGALSSLTVTPASDPLTPGAPASSSSTGKRHTDLPFQSGPGAQYENPHWGALPPATDRSSSTTSSSWDQVIIDGSDTEAWPSISRSSDSRPANPSECATAADCTNPETSSNMSIAAGATSQQAHYPSLKANATNMMQPGGGQGVGAIGSRGWGSGSGPITMGPTEGAKPDGLGPNMGRSGGAPGWNSQPSFSLNLNPNANPSAWPVLGQEGAGGGPNPASLPPNGSLGNSSLGGEENNSSSTWGGMMSPDAPSSNKNVSFSSMEHPNLNTDGQNSHHTKQPLSPIHGLPGWGGQSPTESSQLNGDAGSSVWGNGDTKTSADSKNSGWDSAPSGGMSGWGHSGSGSGGGEGGWGKPSSGGGEAKRGWDSSDGPAQDQQLSSWGQPTPAPTSEGSGSGGSEVRSHRRDRTGSEDGGPPPLPRQDLDPRVLCNTGWGQTPVRQHTSWEMEEQRAANERKTSEMRGGAGGDTWKGSSSPSSGSPLDPRNGGANPNLGPSQRPGSGGSGGKSEGPSGWGGPPPSGWGEQPVNKAPNGSVSGWGEPMAQGHNTTNNGPKSGVQSWGVPEGKSSPTWDDGPTKTHGSRGSNGSNGSNGGEWREPAEVKKNGSSSHMWEGEGGNGRGGGWKDSPRGGGGNGGGWASNPNGPAPGWGSKPQESPNGPAPGWGSKPQESPNGNSGGVGTGGGSMGSWGGPASVRQSSNPGWGPGSSGAKPDPAMEPTGWEEPSPPSIRRKMEIDDGTSTWGDPSAYNKTVNMWDRNNPTGGNGNQGNAPTQPPTSKSNGSMAVNNSHNHSSVPPSWGELPSVQQPKPEMAWGEPAGPSPAVDNGTSAWGKPPGVPGGWGDGGHEPNGPYRRGNNGPSGPAPCKPAPKSMQDGWGGGREEEMGMSSGQWDTDAGDMWNSPASQESSTSCNSWGQPPKKGPPKGKMGNQPDEAWIMNRLIKQLTDMGFPRDPAEEALKSNDMNLDQAMSALLEKKTELDKRGMGMSDYNNGMNKPLGCRPQALSKDPSSDRSPFLDKLTVSFVKRDGGLSDDTPPSPFLPSPVSLKLPLINNLQPGLALGSPGLNMQNLNNRQVRWGGSGMLGSSGAALSRAMQQPPPQPSVPPLGSSQPNLRAQVPQFLTPQVQAQLLQFAAKNIGLNPALLTSPINPQQMTLLYQLQQLQMAYQRLQIQQQMMQAQRNVSGPIRQQEQQVARTINNMQQQIQQHQRQLYQALLMKQHQGKSALDSFPGHPQAPGLSDLHTKEPQSSPNSYSPYPLSGLNPNMNVNCMEVGGLSMKEPPQPQSRLSQWTHSNSMDSLSGNSSHMEPNLNKHGAISAASNLGPPGKPPHMDDSYSPYSMMGGSESPTSPLVPPDSWGQGPGKSPKDQITNGTNINWPPEFCPGVPWKGLQNIDPENDPNMTPGSVPSGPTINTNIQDVNRYLLRDRSGGKLSDMKSTWSPGPISHPSQASLSHELWKVPQGPRNNTAPSRPPPGLTNPAKPSSTWGGNSLGLAQGWSSSYTSEGTTWSTDSSNRTSSWLVLRNLTPQIDGSTLRTLCMQHGPLITFHLFLTQGNAVVRYSSKEEAAKAQKSLHMCVLGNTTILAEFAGEEEVNRYFAQGQQQLPPTTSWQPNPGTNQMRMGGGVGSQQHAIGHHWSSAGGGLGGGAKTGGGGDLLWGGVPQYSSLWGPPSGDDSRGVIGSPNPINTLLPGDLLSGESM
uniref:Trinucleotide repeat-containing gene 6C protein n=1 Tax=Oncorhynchus tshawytscha TaxID=74940 RepID=A0A8C8G8Z5_ONCTS